MPDAELEIFAQRSRAHVFLIIDGGMEFILSLFYFIFFRVYFANWITVFQQAQHFNFDVALFLDIVFGWVIVLSVIHFISAYCSRVAGRDDIARKLNLFSIANHILLIPLSGLLDVVIDRLFT